MDQFRINGFKDNSTITGIGSLFKRTDGSRWHINLTTTPSASGRSYLSFSQAPIITRQRILNTRANPRKNGYLKSFIIPNTNNWVTEKVKNSRAIKRHFKADGEQNCFVFYTEDETKMYLPQFELARALFFHDGYLSRSALTPDVLSTEFEVLHKEEAEIAEINVMPSCSYKMEYFNEPSNRRLLSWILLNENVRNSYESISRYQLLDGINMGAYRLWDFQFDAPDLANTKFDVKGWFDPELNEMFIHEIVGLSNIPMNLPRSIYFAHPNFTKDVNGKGNGGYAANGERPEEHNIEDDSSASDANNAVMIKPPSIKMSFNQVIETVKIAKKKNITSHGKTEDDAPSKTSKDVSMEEATAIGELPSADWDSLDDQTDDSHLYINKFESYFKMLQILKENYGCEITIYPLRKLPKVPRCKKHLLATDGNPRCLSVSYLIVGNKSYYLLEVDTSDTNKPLSTRVIQSDSINNLQGVIAEIEKQLLKRSLMWPKDYFDSIISSGSHFGISHQKSKHGGSLSEEDIIKWAKRFVSKLNSS